MYSRSVLLSVLVILIYIILTQMGIDLVLRTVLLGIILTETFVYRVMLLARLVMEERLIIV